MVGHGVDHERQLLGVDEAVGVSRVVAGETHRLGDGLADVGRRRLLRVRGTRTVTDLALDAGERLVAALDAIAVRGREADHVTDRTQRGW